MHKVQINFTRTTRFGSGFVNCLYGSGMDAPCLKERLHL